MADHHGRSPETHDLRIAIARDVLRAMIHSVPPSVDMTAIDEHVLARRAVAFADALIEALGLSSDRGNAR